MRCFRQSGYGDILPIWNKDDIKNTFSHEAISGEPLCFIGTDMSLTETVFMKIWIVMTVACGSFGRKASAMLWLKLCFIQPLCSNVSCVVAQWLRVELRSLDWEDPGSNPALPCITLGKFFHSVLLQFTQLYEWVPGYRQWWIFMYKQSLRDCRIAGCFPEKPRWSSIEQVCQGVKCKKHFEQS